MTRDEVLAQAKSLLSFRGRMRRSTYWTVVLLSAAVMLLIGLAISPLQKSVPVLTGPLNLLVLGLWAWVATAAQVKRAHDRGRSGWFVLLLALPFIWFWPFVDLGFLEGDNFTNKYGPSPKARDARVEPRSLYDGIA